MSDETQNVFIYLCCSYYLKCNDLSELIPLIPKPFLYLKKKQSYVFLDFQFGLQF